MAHSHMSRRIFGGKETAPTTGSARYARPLFEPEDQAVAETLTVATINRMFPGPGQSQHPAGGGVWSYHVNNVSPSGATSTLKFYFSNLPDPDPTDATHWKDSGITAIDLTAVAVSFATRTADFPLWILAQAVVVTSAGTIWAYVRTDGVDA